jgi:hypothetical protein
MKMSAARAVPCQQYFEAKRRRKIMSIKYILAVALITPFLTVSSTAQQYQGGPKSSVPPTMLQIGYGDIYAQGIDVYAPRGDIYAQGVRTNKSRAYPSGPRTVVPYGR